MSRVLRVNGPLVEASRLAGVAMAELVAVGRHRLPAEVVALGPDRMTLQAYEYTGSLAPGDPAVALGRPLAARLGPGLLGGVFDGLLRPLDRAATWLAPGAFDGTDGRTWSFTPSAAEGGEVAPGQLLGTVTGAGSLAHRVLVPPGVAGRLRRLCPAGRYRGDEPVAMVGGTAVTLATWWPVRRPRPWRERLPGGAPLLTGQRVLDVVFPVTKGGTAAVPGGFGTGKTVLLQQVAKWCGADVIVYIGCGERGNEMADVVAELAELADPRTGGRLADRTVVIANTSNMPIMAREASIYTGVTVAEYYRDMGYDTVVIADSTTRWAEALREFASRTGALPAEEGYPAGLASALAAFYERAGVVTTLGGSTGSVTVIGAVSPPGGDMTEPVTAHTQRFIRTLWMLDRDLAYARHYPAVAWAGSYCRDAGTVAAWHARNGDPEWARRRARVVALLGEADRLTALAELVGVAALPGHERMVMLAGRLLREAVLQQSALSTNDAQCTPAKAAALVDVVLGAVAGCDRLVEAGVAAAAVEELDLTPLVRVREETGPDDAAGVRRRGEAMLARLEGLR
ncbi:MAG TPA: V-type ATP synthase subunit A [Micromonosporaceae bacterium]|nr:V-type ATP synthase subunit A [Micromonosporaceae bacterium]